MSVDNPQLGDIYKEIIDLSKETGVIKGHVETTAEHVKLINGTLKSHAIDIQEGKIADAIAKAATDKLKTDTVKFRWFFGSLISIVAIAASAWFKFF